MSGSRSISSHFISSHFNLIVYPDPVLYPVILTYLLCLDPGLCRAALDVSVVWCGYVARFCRYFTNGNNFYDFLLASSNDDTIQIVFFCSEFVPRGTTLTLRFDPHEKGDFRVRRGSKMKMEESFPWESVTFHPNFVCLYLHDLVRLWLSP